MSGIDDLRRTLEDHATGLAPSDSSVRRTAVHERIGVVRRRRRAAVAGAAAAVVAIGAGVALLPDPDREDAAEPAAQRAFGLDVPATIRVLGYTYRLVEVVEGEDGAAAVRLGSSDVPRVVTWATEGADQRVTLSDPEGRLGPDQVTYTSPDLDGWQELPDTEVTFDVRAAGSDVAAAVYQLDPDAPTPAGTTSIGATFRDEAPGLQLHDAAVGAPGLARVSVATDLAGSRAEVYAFCSGGPSDAFVDYTVGSTDGGVQVSRACDEPVPFDVLSEITEQELSVAPGDTVTVTVRDEDGRVVEDDDLVVGLGVYDPATRRGAVQGSYEAYGHQWRLVSSETAPTGLTSWTVLAPDAPELPVLAVTVGELGESSDAEVLVLADGSSPTSFSGGSEFTSAALVDAGAEVGYDVDSGVLEPDDRVTVGFYVRAD